MRHSESKVCCFRSLSSPHGCGALAITPYPAGASHVSLDAVVLDRPGLATEGVNRQQGTMPDCLVGMSARTCF